MSDCNVPIIRDADDTLTSHCKTEQGGDMTVKPPQYDLTVTNPPDTATSN